MKTMVLMKIHYEIQNKQFTSDPKADLAWYSEKIKTLSAELNDSLLGLSNQIVARRAIAAANLKMVCVLEILSNEDFNGNGVVGL